MKLNINECAMSLSAALFADIVKYEMVDKYAKAVVDSILGAFDDTNKSPKFIPFNFAIYTTNQKYTIVYGDGKLYDDVYAVIKRLSKIPKIRRSFISDTVDIDVHGRDLTIFIDGKLIDHWLSLNDY